MSPVSIQLWTDEMVILTRTYRDAGNKCKLLDFPPHRITRVQDSLTPPAERAWNLAFGWNVIGLFGHLICLVRFVWNTRTLKNEAALSKTPSLTILPLQFLLDEGFSTTDQLLFSPCEDLELLIFGFLLPCINACHH